MYRSLTRGFLLAFAHQFLGETSIPFDRPADDRLRSPNGDGERPDPQFSFGQELDHDRIASGNAHRTPHMGRDNQLASIDDLDRLSQFSLRT
jgi:hypothetical protein